MLHRHWKNVIHPLLTALSAGPIVEIGAAAGTVTVKLAELCVEHDLTLHSVDPAPDLDPAEYEKRFAGHLHFHRERSHVALEKIGPAAAVLIDGDHNWYTVYGELTRLQEIASSADRHFPLVMLHDVEWPYARRDMYYDPAAIPDEWRRPWARRGIRWGETLLDETGGGINSHLANAIEEGGPRNGVLTAVEDFVGECPLPLERRIVRGNAGIAVLASREMLSATPALEREWNRLHSPEFLLDRAEELSRGVARETSARIEASREAKRLGLELESARKELAAARQRAER